MNPPETLEDHAQLFLNLYRGRVPLGSKEWHYLEEWAVRLLRHSNPSSHAASNTEEGK